MKKIVTVQGLQFGSEAKGNIAALVARMWGPDTVASAWGPNAGHTAWVEGQKFIHTMLPIGALAPSVQQILLGPGSVISPYRLCEEIRGAVVGNKRLLEGKDLVVHPQAVIWSPDFATQEKELVAIGSTMKGMMMGTFAKMQRNINNPVVARLTASSLHHILGETFANAGMSLSISERKYDMAVDGSEKMLLEGAQGFSLGMHTDFYPYCTSRDVSTAQLLADCRIPFPYQDLMHTIGVFRTYPIRVANRYKDNELIGTSGGHYSDQEELNWGDIGREPELTTVTKLPRRLFTFSLKQIKAAIRIMRPRSLAMTFCDYLTDTAIEKVGPGEPIPNRVNDLDTRMNFKGSYHCPPVRLMSFGPTTEEIYEAGVLISEAVNILDVLHSPELGFLP